MAVWAEAAPWLNSRPASTTESNVLDVCERLRRHFSIAGSDFSLWDSATGDRLLQPFVGSGFSRIGPPEGGPHDSKADPNTRV